MSGERAEAGQQATRVARIRRWRAVADLPIALASWLPVAPALIYAALALLLTWPLVLRLGSAYPATPGEGAQDLWQNLWNLWWAGQALRRGINPFFTDMLFYPQGASLLFHPLNLTSGVLALPLRALFGQVVAYNLLVLLSFILSGYAVFLLARRHACGWMASLTGGLVYTGAAFHFFHLRLGHLEQISMQWLPLYALALDGLLRGGAGWKTGGRPARGVLRPFAGQLMLATLALLAVIFTSLYMALYAALLTALWAVWPPAEPGAGHQAAVRSARFSVLGRRFLTISALAALTLAISGPLLLIPMAREAQQATYMVRSMADAVRGAAAPADAIMPPASHPLRAVLSLPVPQSGGAFLGYLPLGLAACGLVARARAGARWFALACIAWLLALGPALPFYRLLYALPPLQVARYPDRFAILVLLGVAVLAALGADAAARRMKGQAVRPIEDPPVTVPPRLRAALPLLRHGVGVLLFALVLFELSPGAMTLTEPIDNPFYHRLAREGGAFSVLELPINRTNNTSVDMAAQTIHGRPILYGALARDVPRIPFEWMPLVRELEHPDAPTDIVAQPDTARQSALRFFGLRYLIYHRTDERGPITPPTEAALSRVAGVPVTQIYADQELVAFRIDAPEGPAALAPIAATGEGWYNLEASPLGMQRWLRQTGGSIRLYAASDGMAALRIRLLAYRQARRLNISLDGRPVAQIEAQPWPAEVVTPPFELRAGMHTVQLAPAGPGIVPRVAGAGSDERPLTVAIFALEVV